MANPYHSFAERVEYARQKFLTGGCRVHSGDRSFDTCFEMHDGDAVCAALVREARKCRALWDGIAADWNGVFPQRWLDHEARFEREPDLGAVSKRLRAKANADFAAWMEQQRPGAAQQLALL